MEKISVHASGDYDVLIEKGLLAKCGKEIANTVKSRKTVIISDDIVERHYGHALRKTLRANGFTVSTFVFMNGEKQKCLSTLSDIYDFMSEKDLTRSDSVIALGGGVVGDIAGFAAATYLRGIDYVQIPTTLLAAVDSSVGGKTAIDLDSGKNLVGAFKQPVLVVCDPLTLDTLSPKNFSDGMGEVIKYGMIKDADLFETLEKNNSITIKEIIPDIIKRCVEIKRDVVEADEKENSLRMILNFGHTIGHAIENYYNYETYTHGSAVAIGMCEMSKKTASPDISKRLEKVCMNYNLPIKCDAEMKNLLPLCRHDKKNRDGKINFITCETIGKAEIKKLDFTDFDKLMTGSDTTDKQEG